MPAPEAPPGAGAPPRYIGVAVGAAALLAAAGGAAFYWASEVARAPAAADAAQVTITAHACEPDSLTVPAGMRRFAIVNRSDRAVEWEILDGVMVVDERENIAPGIRQTLSTELRPGDYQMTCGLLSNPRGALHVTPSREAPGAAPAPTLRAFIGPLAEYQFYAGRQANAMAKQAQALADAVKAGKLDQARETWLAARAPYMRLETVAYRFSDLANRLNPTAVYLAKREADPAFTGFHRLAYGLFATSGTQGLAPVADMLAADAADLKARLRTAKLTPADLVGGAAHLATQIAERVGSGEDASSKTDLDDMAANLDGIGEIVELMTPVVEKSAPDAAAGARKALAAARAALGAQKKGDSYPKFDAVGASARKEIAERFGALADALAKLEPAVGVGS